MNDWNENDFLDEDEQAAKAKRYHDSYIDAMSNLTKDLDDQESIFSTMQDIRYRPTNDAEQDAELNFLRAKNIVSSKKKKLGKAADGKIDSFLKYKQRADGKSASEIQRWAKKVIAKDD